jgi:hypothetical protein
MANRQRRHFVSDGARLPAIRLLRFNSPTARNTNVGIAVSGHQLRAASLTVWKPFTAARPTASERTNTWEQSYDQGGSWVAATTTPTAANTTNIRQSHAPATAVAVDEATLRNGSNFWRARRQHPHGHGGGRST